MLNKTKSLGQVNNKRRPMPMHLAHIQFCVSFSSKLFKDLEIES